VGCVQAKLGDEVVATGKPIAEELAKKQREISVSEFFERNKHILGFDSSTRAIITTIKEAVDNALDACEESGILPDLSVEIHKVKDDEFRLVVEDNGPGIVKQQIPNIFGRLLYGSRFHAIRQTRGAQGIGISAAVMYGTLTTGKPARITSKIGPGYPAYVVDIVLDTRKNRADIVKQDMTHWEKDHGTRVEIHLEGKYQRGQQSVLEYMRSTAIVNPHARLSFLEPDGTRTIFERATDQLPAKTVEIKPHPNGIELGMLLKLLKDTQATKLTSFLTTEFSRIGHRSAREMCDKAGLDEGRKPSSLALEEVKALHAAMRQVKVMAPPTDCLSPIGEYLVKKGLKKELPDGVFVATSTRPPSVYGGNPFQVEAGIAYGGPLAPDEQVRILRFANRVPLLYQRGGCAITHVVEGIDWRRYDLEQRGGKGIPYGPAVLLVHVASTNVPYTSEAKEAVADIAAIESEIELALRDCARKMKAHIHKRKKYDRMKEKMELIRKILPRIADKSAKVLGKPVPDIEPVVAKIMNNMMIAETIEYVGPDRRHVVKVEIKNYTSHGKNVSLYASVPHGAAVGRVDPKPSEQTAEHIRWDLKRIPTGEARMLSFEFVGLDKDAYDETDLYVSGIDAELVIGAEPWKPNGGEA